MANAKVGRGNGRVRVQKEPQRRVSPAAKTRDSDAEHGQERLSHPRSPLVGNDFGDRAFERHAVLLSDSRMSHPMYASERAGIFQQLQRDYGNRYVQRLVHYISRKRAEAIQTKLTVGPAGDQYEQEADRVAKQVVSTISSHGQDGAQRQEEEEMLQAKPQAQRQEEEEMLQAKPVAQRQEEEEMLQAKPQAQRQEEEEEMLQAKPQAQRQEEEEEMLQAKPQAQRQEEEEEMLRAKPQAQRQEEEEEMLQAKPQAQRQEEEEMLQAKPMVQRRVGSEGGDVDPQVEQLIQQKQGRGQSLPDGLRTSMEGAFATDFSGVRIHNDSESEALNSSMSARAFTMGKDIFIRQGEYNPGSSSGQELLAHELTHVVQQSSEKALQRAQVEIGAGVFEDTEYIPINSVSGDGKSSTRGARMILTFKPHEDLDATEVSLVQTTNSNVKNITTENIPDQTESLLEERRTAAGSAVDQQIFLPGQVSPMGMPKPKRTNLDPRYHEERSSTDEPLANPMGKPSGGQAAIKREEEWRQAMLKDEPAHNTKPGDTLIGTESFEVAAMADGSKFLGSVRWGWKVNAKNQAELAPSKITLVSDSSASPEFFASAAAWNEMEVNDDKGKHKTIQLPTSPAWQEFVTFLRAFDPDSGKVDDLVKLGKALSEEEKQLAIKGTPHFNLRKYLDAKLTSNVIDALG